MFISRGTSRDGVMAARLRCPLAGVREATGFPRYSSKTACALVPPNPKADKPALFSPSLGTSGHFVFSTTKFLSTALSTPGVPGMTPWRMLRSTLHIPAKPALTNVWPKLPLVEPYRGHPSALKQCFMASTSALSPCTVPVAWHSTYCIVLGETPIFLYVSSKHVTWEGWCGLSGSPVPAFDRPTPSKVP